MTFPVAAKVRVRFGTVFDGAIYLQKLGIYFSIISYHSSLRETKRKTDRGEPGSIERRYFIEIITLIITGINAFTN